MRETCLEPRKISVTEAAKLIGISRPGVSNFLNGRVSATENIASRIERAFGIPAADLLRMQAEYDAHTASAASAPPDTRSYVPPFLGIRANEIDGWADHNISARIRFSIFLRTLVNSTGLGLERVVFPGNDDAERPGWDGFTEASAGTPWIPKGKAGWEFGVTADAKSKADGDFAKSVKGCEATERSITTFIFVTPRRWPGKDAWASAMRAKRQWKDVRAYDASDLEQWLEQSPAGQAWFAGETLRASGGVRSLDRCWTDWAGVASPPISKVLFDTVKDVAKPKIAAFLDKPPGNPFVIAADSSEEALALLAQVFAKPELESSRDRVLVFDETLTLSKLALGTQTFIAVVHTREVERELGPLIHKLHAIVIYPRNATNEDPDITLEPLSHEAFRKGLEAMEFNRDDVTRLGHESGHSLTVLRRRLSKVEAVRTPAWASDTTKAAWLIPIMMIGAWNSKSEADQTAISLLSGENVSYEEVERRTQELLRLNDTPVWSIGHYRGVVSKIDALFAIAHAITHTDLERYFGLARIILSEDDPSLDLPEEDRWWSDIQGKRREFSGTLRSGVSETLVLLAVHGKHLFKRFGFDGEAETARFIRELLLPLTTRKLEANDRDLPVYAEVAPDAFLKILEDDLSRDSPEVIRLLRPVDTSLFGAGSVRTGLLWALEGLAWNPQTFLRTILILARLSEVEINDNLANKPIASLKSIFCSWMPQTAADSDTRIRAIEIILGRHPSIGWKVCTDQISYGSRVGHYTHKPRWRPDGYGFGEPFTFPAPVHRFEAALVELMLSRPNYTADMICDLVERLHSLDGEYQKRVWNIIDGWRNCGVSDEDIAQVREKIRVTVLSLRGRRRSVSGDFTALTKSARETYDALEPKDLINKHAWLFRQAWVEESADERNEGDLDLRKRDERIRHLRTSALREIYGAKGTAGIFDLVLKGNAQNQIGWHMAHDVLAQGDVGPFILEALEPGSNKLTSEYKSLISGALRAMPESNRRTFLSNARSELGESDMVRLLLLAPFERTTWHIADQMSARAQELFWGEVHPEWIFDPEEQNNEAIERLIKVKRPRAAFAAVHFKLEAIRPFLLFEMLTAIAQDGNDKEGEYRLHDYDIKEAFVLLHRNPDVTLEQKASLEFAYIDILAEMFGRDGRHIVNLERYVGTHPEFWVRALVWAYKRRHGGEDPEAYKLPEGRQDLAERAYRLLEGLQRLPGQDVDEVVDKDKLMTWVSAVRSASEELDRLDICDLSLGKLFSHAPQGSDGVWPCDAVRDVMETLQSERVFEGAHTGLYNSRGVHWRGEGGGQERELALQYRGWAEALQFTHTRLASSLLMGMAKTYEREAESEDTEAGIRRRLRH